MGPVRSSALSEKKSPVTWVSWPIFSSNVI